MQRRDFLKSVLPLGMMPLATSGFPFRTLGATSPWLLNPCNVTDRSVVIIFLAGGNDILNTTVPLNQHAIYAGHRPDLYIPESSLITLDSTLPTQKQLGLHPSLTAFKNLYDDGKMALIQRVGYAEPNKSHFKALDNWLTGTGGVIPDQDNGWIARFLENRYPSFQGLPFVGEPDPLGVLFGNMNETGFHTLEQHRFDINLSGQDLAGFYTLISTLNGQGIPNIPISEHGDMLRHIETIGNSVNVYAQRISETFNNGSNSNSVTYPANQLGDQLRTVARMLKGGSRTKIFMATQGGFDTHVLMVDEANHAAGYHADLLGGTANAIKAFQDDLAQLGLDNNVLTVVFSEFGRKVTQNGSFGLDHGTLSSMFVVGTGVEGGVVGNNISLTNLDNDGAPNPNQLQSDYRSVFGGILQDWLGANDAGLQSTFLTPSVYSPKVSVINQNNVVPSSCYFTPAASTICACLQVRVYLEGFLSTGGVLPMRTNLLSAGLIPLSQPYGAAPFNYTGTQTVTSIPANVVDWVLVELRQPNDPTVVVTRRAFFLRNDGMLLKTDGSLGIDFPGIASGYYYLAVFHRNHLAILSNGPVEIQDTGRVLNFGLDESMVTGVNQLKKIGTIWVMRAGDFDGSQNINHSDHNGWSLANGQQNTYSAADFNGDGEVSVLDFDLWDLNRSKLGHLH